MLSLDELELTMEQSEWRKVSALCAAGEHVLERPSCGNPTVSSNGRGDNHQTLLQLANTDSGEQVGSQADTTSSTTVQTHNHHHAKPSSM